jgi:hypothetical protein
VLALTIILAGMAPSAADASPDNRGALRPGDPPLNITDGTSNTRSR